MSMSVGGSSEYSSDINVTPMVDIMLVLLIIFMVVTPLLSSGINVVLPTTENSQEDEAITKETSVIVSVPERNQFYIGKEMVDRSKLSDLIKQKMKDKKNEDKVVYIKGGHLVDYGEIVDTITAVRNAGIDRIGLVTEKKKDTKKK
ncbi:MAG: biopolymer transporter ExbD [Blastocatellia bacterium]|nr:biopolymer transporter ExbD [Blastocatellia bacterium]